MENLSINTTQNVQLNYNTAGIGLRLAAIVIDSIIKFAYIFLVYYLFYNAIYKNYYSGNAYNNMSNSIITSILILLGLPYLFYHLLCETFLNGQSFGKKLFKLKVVKLDGSQASFGTYLIRSIFRIIDDNFIGLICVLATQNAQRIGDMAAGTTVIALNKEFTLNDTILYENNVEYKITFEQVSLLNDKDASLIKEVLDFSEKQNQPKHLALMASKIKDKYGINANDMDNSTFLKTLLKDYSNYQFEK
ncbi:MAG: RDD family protein [Bacteroidetes bacterium]|nr:RDD family protein [Bacteroidota bacterium]